MFKIIEHGTLKNTIFVCKCTRCGCKFECDKGYENTYGSIACPECIYNSADVIDKKRISDNEYNLWKQDAYAHIADLDELKD